MNEKPSESVEPLSPVPPADGDTQQPDGMQRPGRRRGGVWAILAVAGFVLLKLKYLLVALKLGKFGVTLVSMGVMVGVYTMQFGWWYALGIVLLIAVHESGHVLAARHVGLKASMPIFIPFVGAFITMKQQPANARVEAVVAAGGPVIGSLGALACLGAGIVLRSDLLLALAYTGCLINLFNLVPVSPLDGGRMVTAISPYMWLIGIPVLVLVAIRFPNPLTILLVLLGAIQAWRMWRSPDKSYFKVSPGTRVTFAALYFGLMIVLGSVMAWVHGLHAAVREL